MYADLGPGQSIEFDPPAPNGVELGYSHAYVFERSRNGRGEKRRETLRSDVNLYEYVNGMPLTNTDPSGREPVAPSAIVAGAVGASGLCLLPHFFAAYEFYPNDEEMRHCYAACTAAKSCTAVISAIGGMGFELATSTMRGFTDAETANALYDIATNVEGIKCAGAMGLVGPIMIGWCALEELANPLIGSGCAGCCERKFHKKK